MIHAPEAPAEGQCSRWQLTVTGVVQGVGFRPFLWRQATALDLTGWIANGDTGVVAQFQGDDVALNSLLKRIESEAPQTAHIDRIDCEVIPVEQDAGIEIRDSLTGHQLAQLPPDRAPCPACLAEMADPTSRFYGYPFTSCTDCGPRVSIATGLPFDRARTTMAPFIMCADCQADYLNPDSRRFHAQTIACPVCGPKLSIDGVTGSPLETACEAIAAGKIVAVQSVGGFHLMVDASNADAVARLRKRKARRDKPFAIIAPDTEWVNRHCRLSDVEQAALIAPERPIVLLQRISDQGIAPAVAPGNPLLGVMLAPSGLHVLIMERLARPLVATSGNLSGEPQFIRPDVARDELSEVADCFLTHDRAISGPLDDSVVREIGGRIVPLRRARGYVPLALPIRESGTVLALGGHMKVAPALAQNHKLYLAGPVGDMESARARTLWRECCIQLESLIGVAPLLAHDNHPHYFTSTEVARDSRPSVGVQHHLAHALACLLDNDLTEPVLAVVWDGTGYGADGTIWGGEFLSVEQECWSRVAHLRPFHLPGGEAAVRDVRRAAAGLAHEIGVDIGTDALLVQMMERDTNAPRVSSMGRLFDGVAALLGLAGETTFEGQAAMALEYTAEGGQGRPYDLDLKEGVLDWSGMVMAIIDDRRRGVPLADIAAGFHEALARAIVAVAEQIGRHNIVLTGGCFQNKRLCEHAIRALNDRGFSVFWHRNLPPNDGALAVGQAVAALRATY